MLAWPILLTFSLLAIYINIIDKDMFNGLGTKPLFVAVAKAIDCHDWFVYTNSNDYADTLSSARRSHYFHTVLFEPSYP